MNEEKKCIDLSLAYKDKYNRIRTKNMEKKQLKLYVWENVLTDYTSGMICILAYDLDQAKELLLEKYDNYYADDFGKPHKVITEPEAFAVFGGG